MEDFKVGDIVKSKNPFCKYKILEVLPDKLKVSPTDKGFDDIVHTCNKTIFKKVLC